MGVHHVRFVMFFDYILGGKVAMHMESAAFFDHNSVVSGGECEVWGDLRLRQEGILPQSSATRAVYNSSIIVPSNGGIDSMEQVLFTTMLRDYLQRNETTEYAQVYPVWTAGAGRDFILKVHVKIPVAEHVSYRPGVLETLRYGVLQFLAV